MKIEEKSQCTACGGTYASFQMHRHEVICARVKSLLGEGLDDYAIAERLGLKVLTISSHRFRITGRRGTGRAVRANGKTDEETLNRIRELSSEGWPPGEIQAELGVSADVVRRYQTHPENGQAWAAVARWASKNHPKLWMQIQPPATRRYA